MNLNNENDIFDSPFVDWTLPFAIAMLPFIIAGKVCDSIRNIVNSYAKKVK